MPRKNKSSDSESSLSCIYCGEHVLPTTTPPVQNSRKTKVQSQNRALAARIRRHKFMIEKLANRASLNPIKRRRISKRKQKKRVQKPIKASVEGDSPIKTTLTLKEMLEEGEHSPMYKGLILGFRLGSGLIQELEIASGNIPRITSDQCRELLLQMPSFLSQKMEPQNENPAQQSKHVLLSAENLSQEAQHGSSAVVGRPSQNLEVTPGRPNQTECPNEIMNLTSIYTQTESRSQPPNLGISNQIINQIDEDAPSGQKDDPILKPEDGSMSQCERKPDEMKSHNPI